ncbi:MAG: PEP-utilizing enzyme [Patescibacteria group bacterium]|jgi:phosphohistidine swiveling domain-containing protein
MAVSPKQLQRPDWLKIWAGSWTLLSCTHFAEEYTRLIRFGGKPFLPECVVVVRHGKSEGWATAQDRQAVCSLLAKQVEYSTERALTICHQLKKQTDNIYLFMHRYNGKEINRKIYDMFWETIVRYYHEHINVKYVVDGLTPKRLKELLPHFEDARVYAEKVLYPALEDFLMAMARRIGKKVNLPAELVLCVTKDEIRRYFKIGKLPQKSVLQKRDKLFAIYSDKRRYWEYDGKTAEQVIRVLTEVKHTNELPGMTAYPGIVRGRVRIVHDPKRASNFKTGDILVSGMTRPEFLPLMKKAAAFVTDSGGILSHAAITARELKKPCVINTKNGTKVLKDGDMVEVDATKGVIKKIS